MRRGLGLGLIALAFLSSVAALSEAGSINKKQGTCNYTILIETTCAKGAGTSDHVSLRFGDSSSNDILARHLNTRHTKRVDNLGVAILDDVPRKPFRECAIDVFEIAGKCIQSQVCYMYLKLRGDDNWRPGRAQVLVSGAPELSSNSFSFQRFLPRHVWHGFDACAGEVTPFGIKKERKVFAAKNVFRNP